MMMPSVAAAGAVGGVVVNPLPGGRKVIHLGSRFRRALRPRRRCEGGVAALCAVALSLGGWPLEAGAVGSHAVPIAGDVRGARLIDYVDPSCRFSVPVPSGWTQLVDDDDSPGFLESVGVLASFSDPHAASGQMITVFRRGGEGGASSTTSGPPLSPDALVGPLLAANAPSVSLLEGPSPSGGSDGVVEATLVTVGQAAGRFTGGVVELLAFDQGRGLDYRAAVPRATWDDAGGQIREALLASRSAFVGEASSTLTTTCRGKE